MCWLWTCDFFINFLVVPYMYINVLVLNHYWQNSVVLNYIFYCSHFHYNSSTRSLRTIIFWYNCDSCSLWWLIFYTFFVVIVAMVHFSKYSLEVISVRRYQRFGFPCFSNSRRFFHLKWDILESRILMIVCESEMHIYEVSWNTICGVWQRIFSLVEG